MKKITALSFLFSVLLLIVSCKHHFTKIENSSDTRLPLRLFSKNVDDSFSVMVSLPHGYDTAVKEKYPVVYILDANFYFDIMATAIKKYSEVGLEPNVILVGIGYKDLMQMDSLRNRDFTGPKAFPEYEMNVSGGADKFLHFINEELSPYIDREYRTDTTQRTIAGHSLGGYFVVYALHDQLAGRSNSFHNFIAASPSFNYNNYHLNEEFNKLKFADQHSKLKLYFTYGGLEDEEEGDEPGIKKVDNVSKQFTKMLSDKFSKIMEFKYDYFSNLAHMETPYPSFMKGLQWVSSGNN